MNFLTLATAIGASLLFSSCSATQLKRPFLWSFEKDGNKSYILGTQHVGVAYDDLPDWVIELMDQKSGVCAELVDVDFADEDSEDYKQHEFERRGQFFRRDQEKTLDSILSPHAWSAIVEVGKEKEISSDALRALSPYGAMAIIPDPGISKGFVLNRYNVNSWNPVFSMDLNLIKRARKQEKPMIGLDNYWHNRRACANERGRTAVENWAAGRPFEKMEYDDFLATDYRSGDGNLSSMN